jgi:hypothetical protein
VEPSEEIRRVVIRFFEALRDGDEEAVSNRISRQPGFERFGTDAVEWWQDGEAAARVWIQVMRETDGYPWRLVGDVHAMSEGSVGWAGGRAEFDASEGAVELRFTCVLHLELGEWKLVQWHGSVPSSNEEHGFFITKSVDEIADAVSESRPDLADTSAPDGTVTIAFTDIEDSLRLNAFLGDRRWVDVLRAHNEVVKHTTDDYGGTVVKNQGDGFMLAFRLGATRRDVRTGDRDRRGGCVPRPRFADPGSHRPPRGRDGARGRRPLRSRGQLRGEGGVRSSRRGDRGVVPRPWAPCSDG